MRFEVDTCFEANDNTEASEPPPPDNGTSLHESLAQLSITMSNQFKPGQSQLTTVIRRGQVTPLSTMAEIKARGKNLSLGQAIPQLWFGRTPHLLRGAHQNGNFTNVVYTNAVAHFPKWEEKHQEELRKLAGLITMLRETAMTMEDGACIAVCDNKIRPLTLQVYAAKNNSGVLPQEVIGQYWGKQNNYE